MQNPCNCWAQPSHETFQMLNGNYLIACHVVTGHDHKVKKAVGGLDPRGLQAISKAII